MEKYGMRSQSLSFQSKSVEKTGNNIQMTLLVEALKQKQKQFQLQKKEELNQVNRKFDDKIKAIDEKIMRISHRQRDQSFLNMQAIQIETRCSFNAEDQEVISQNNFSQKDVNIDNFQQYKQVGIQSEQRSDINWIDEQVQKQFLKSRNVLLEQLSRVEPRQRLKVESRSAAKQISERIRMKNKTYKQLLESRYNNCGNFQNFHVDSHIKELNRNTITILRAYFQQKWSKFEVLSQKITQSYRLLYVQSVQIEQIMSSHMEKIKLNHLDYLLDIFNDLDDKKSVIIEKQLTNIKTIQQKLQSLKIMDSKYYKKFLKVQQKWLRLIEQLNKFSQIRILSTYHYFLEEQIMSLQKSQQKINIQDISKFKQELKIMEEYIFQLCQENNSRNSI